MESIAPEIREMVGMGGTSAEQAAVAASVAASEPRSVFFPLGMPGFPDQHEFSLQPIDTAPSSWMMLRSLTQTTLGFVLMPVAEPQSIYQPAELAIGREALGIEEEDLQTFLVVNIHGRAADLEAYVNLRAPVFVDVVSRQAVQIVLPSSGYSVRHKLQLLRN